MKLFRFVYLGIDSLHFEWYILEIFAIVSYVYLHEVT